MFYLIDQNNEPAVMRSGKPFAYTSRALAVLGKKALEAAFSGPRGNDPSRVFKVVEA